MTLKASKTPEDSVTSIALVATIASMGVDGGFDGVDGGFDGFDCFGGFDGDGGFDGVEGGSDGFVDFGDTNGEDGFGFAELGGLDGLGDRSK